MIVWKEIFIYIVWKITNCVCPIRWSLWSSRTSCRWRRVKGTALLEWSRRPTVRASRTTSFQKKPCSFWGMTALDTLVKAQTGLQCVNLPITSCAQMEASFLPCDSHIDKGVSWQGYLMSSHRFSVFPCGACTSPLHGVPVGACWPVIGFPPRRSIQEISSANQYEPCGDGSRKTLTFVWCSLSCDAAPSLPSVSSAGHK